MVPPEGAETLDLCPARAQAPPLHGVSEGLNPVQIIRRGRRACPALVQTSAAKVKSSRWCRPWARCTPGIWRWSPKRGGGPTASRRRFSSIRCSSARTRTSAATRGRKRPTRRCCERRAATCSGCRSGRRNLSRRASRPRSASTGCRDRWEGEARPGPFRRGRDGRRQIAAARSGPTIALFGEKDFQQLAVIRRMAARSRLGDRDRRRADRARRGRPRSVVAQCLSVARRAQRALALPQALERRRRDAIRSGAAVGDGLSRGQAVAGRCRISQDRLCRAGRCR